MTQPVQAPDTPCCLPWPVDTSCCSDWPGPDAPQEDKDRAQRAVCIASTRLRKLTAGKWGLCEELLRPCATPCGKNRPEWWDRWNVRSPYSGGILDPYVWEGEMRNRACGCREDCSCSSICKVELPGPVDSIVEVRLDGQVVDPATYFLTAEGWLVRAPGEPCWPDCQNMALPDSEDGTFSVRYLRGRDPGNDADALRAVSVLACELYRNMCGRKCRLPGRIKTVTREGVSYDVYTDWNDLGTGLDEVDQWLRIVNPYGARSVPTITTPDLPFHRFYNGRDL